MFIQNFVLNIFRKFLSKSDKDLFVGGYLGVQVADVVLEVATATAARMLGWLVEAGHQS